MQNCPICGKEVGAYHEVTFKEPYIHNIPYDGLMIYGAYSAPKETICHQDNYFHFAFYDAEQKLTDHRLVKLGVESPTTKSPSNEYMEMLGEFDDHVDYDFDPCINCDLPDACSDFGCAIDAGLLKPQNW